MVEIYVEFRRAGTGERIGPTKKIDVSPIVILWAAKTVPRDSFTDEEEDEMRMGYRDIYDEFSDEIKAAGYGIAAPYPYSERFSSYRNTLFIKWELEPRE